MLFIRVWVIPVVDEKFGECEMEGFPDAEGGGWQLCHFFAGRLHLFRVVSVNLELVCFQGRWGAFRPGSRHVGGS